LKNLLISGISGKVGKYVYQYAGRYSFNVVCGVDKRKFVAVDCPVYSSFSEVKENVDVIIDFSSDDLCYEAARYAINNRTVFLTGTTALSEKTKNEIESASHVVPTCCAANYSRAVLTLFKLVRIARKSLADFDCEIIEAHNAGKKDNPSGTTKRLAEENGIKKSYGMRGGTIAGMHTVYFFGNDEELSITHRAYDKGVFADGALSAAKTLCIKKQGLYSAMDLL